MIACILSSARFAMSWKGKICCLFLSGILFVSMHDIKRKTSTLGLVLFQVLQACQELEIACFL
jgi:hypothetical protein